MALNVTFNNISAISRWLALLMEETGVPGENHRPFASHRQTLSHNVVSITPRLNGIRTHNFSGDSFTSNHHTITTMKPLVIMDRQYKLRDINKNKLLLCIQYFVIILEPTTD